MISAVCAVVVTFNRKLLLCECLQALKLQTRPPDKILVIDNASTDGTAAMLFDTFPEIEVIRLAENTGGAGGFRAGMQAAFERGYEWLWVMDDDIETHPDCLERMLRYREHSDFIHVRRHYQRVPYPWESIWDLGRCVTRRTFKDDESFVEGQEWICVNYACFEGALIRRNVVERIGLPDARFFIAGDDSVYGLLASLHARVIYVNFMGIEKKIANAPPDRRKIYFEFRNRFLMYEYLSRCGMPVSKIQFWRAIVVDAAWNFVTRAEIRGVVGLRSIWSGVCDGVTHQFGPPPWIRRVKAS